MTAAVTDFSQFAALRQGAARQDPATLRAVAGQFEALFIETMLKNVRDAALADPVFGQSDQYDMYRGLLDRQLSVEMASGRGIGLAELLVRQLGGAGGAEDAGPKPGGGAFRLPASARVTTASGTGEAASGWSSPLEFARAVWPHVRAAARKIGVAPEAVLAQAALESGWGQQVMQLDDGSSSFNLFGIKAGPDWQGQSATRPTVEYVDGVARRETARFRAYPDLAKTFDDYARLLGEHPRYAAVRGRGQDTRGFAQALQSAGYATDPTYADKITRVLESGVLKKALGTLKHFGDRPIQP